MIIDFWYYKSIIINCRNVIEYYTYFYIKNHRDALTQVKDNKKNKLNIKNFGCIINSVGE